MPQGRSSRAPARGWERWIPYLVGGTALGLCVLSTALAAHNVRDKDRERFDHSLSQARNLIRTRVESTIALLRGGTGLFAADDDVGRGGFRAYVEHLGLEQRYPGTLGIGFTLRVDPAAREELLARMIAEGAGDFRIWPEYERSEEHAVLFLEPQNELNRLAIGYDMFSEAVRREAMARARDTGEPAMSGLVELVQERDQERKQAGFVIYVPLYRGGTRPATVEERRASLFGFVYSPLRGDDFFNGIFAHEANPRVSLSVFDGEGTEPHQLLHGDGRTEADGERAPSFRRVEPMEVAGRTWTLEMATTPGFDLASSRPLVLWTLFGGLAVSAALFASTRFLVRARASAEASAASLEEQTRVLEALNRVGVSLSGELDLERLMQAATDAAREATGAELAALFQNDTDDEGAVYTLYTLSGAPREAFAGFSMPRLTALFGPTWRGEGIVRCEDVTRDPRYGLTPPHHGMPERHPPVRSYLAAPVVSRSGEVIGGLFCGHARAGAFHQVHEEILAGIAAQAAVAIDSARLYERLRESEIQLRTIIDSVPALISYVDAELVYRLNNRAYEEWFGAPIDEITGRPVREVVGERGWRTAEPYLRRALAGESVDAEVPAPRPSGGARWMRASYRPHRDERGAVLGCFVMATDVTERKRTERARLLLATAGASVAPDMEPGTIARRIAASAAGILGEWCVVELAAADGSAAQRAVEAEDAERAAQLERALSAEPIFAPILEDAAPGGGALVLSPDAADQGGAHAGVLDALSARSLVAAVLRTSEGTVGAIVLGSDDADHRLSAEDAGLAEELARRLGLALENARLYRARLESEERYSFLADLVPEIVWTARPDGQIDHFNRRWFELTGLTPEESYGRDGWRHALHPEDVERSLERWYHSVHSGEPFEMERRFRRASDGAWRWYLARALPMRGPGGAIVAWFGTSTDIDDQKRAAAELERQAEDLTRSNAELEQFAYVASHDLQEPLRMVVTYTQLLERTAGEGLDERARECIRYAVEGSLRMQRLIEDLLAYSRVGSGSRVAAVSAETALEGVLDSLRVMIEERGARISHGPLPEVTADATELAQLFQNLLSNGLKFCENHSPEVRVEAERQAGEWVFSVRDNGVGIDPRYRERVFQMFQRLHPRDKFPGTGIGLAICRKIVERHGGRIWFESEPGVGTTFFFSLPERWPRHRI